MKKVLCISILAVFACLGADAFEAGAARVDITPPLGTPLTGYMARWGRGANDIHDELWVRAIYLSAGDTAVFLVSADLCIINRELRDRVLELAPEVVPREHIILTATHTHSAHGGMVEDVLFRPFSGRFMPDVLEATAQGFAQAMRDAYGNRRRAAIGFDTVSQDDLTINRRDPDGPMDPQIGVIRIEDADGAAIAVIANMAAHPTTVWDERQLSISADFPGFFAAELERLMDPGCVALFLNGALGNQHAQNPEDLEGWERTASIGRILAQRVFEVADEIVCGQEPLRFSRATISLPPTLQPAILPDTTTLQSLEIGDLVIHFFPGEPCVEIGLELRSQSRDAGYAAQFSVGLANDHLFYFVPRSLYTEAIYENEMNFYGPGIEDLFYREFARLGSRGEPMDETDIPNTPSVDSFPGGFHVTFEGTPYQIGYQRGQVFHDVIHERYTQQVLEPVAAGYGLPETGWWSLANRLLNLDPITLWRLGYNARPLLAGLSEATFQELEGMAEGAALAFDGIWLTEALPLMLAQEDPEMFAMPYCTLFAAVGDRAGADDLLVGRNLDSPNDNSISVIEVRPHGGRGYLEIGFPGKMGIMTGMNDAGVVVAVESIDAFGVPLLDGPPVGFVLREVLAEAEDFAEALAMVQAAEHLRGIQILVAGPDPDGTAMSDSAAARRVLSAAAIVEFGPDIVTRFPRDGLLYGAVLEEETGDIEGEEDADENADPERDDTIEHHPRYTRLAGLLSEGRIISANDIMEALGDEAPQHMGRDRIYHSETRYSAVFEPNSRRVMLRVRQADGNRGPAQTFTLSPSSGNGGSDS